MKKLLFFSALAAMTLVACQSYDTELPMPDDEAALTAVQKEEITQITEDVNSGEVKNILGSLFGKQRKGRSADYTVSLLKDKQGVDRVICINYADNGGFALISAEKTHSPILAYAEEGNFSVTDSLPFPLSEWMDCTMHSIAESESLPADSLEKIAGMWHRYEVVEPIKTLSDRKSRSIDPEEYYELSQIMMTKINEWNSLGYRVYSINNYNGTTSFGDNSQLAGYVQGYIWPVYFEDYADLTVIVEIDKSTKTGLGHCLTTKWDQYSGFNQSFPTTSDNITGHIPAGCGPVAVGQILYANKYPSYFNWNGMSKVPSGNKTTSDFLLDVYYKCNAKYDKNTGTGCSQEDRANALKAYGYTCQLIDDPKQITKSVLLTYSPSIISSELTDKDGKKGRHAWIVEGGEQYTGYIEKQVWTFTYEKTFSCIHHEEELIDTGTLFYANWGWGGDKDGFFGFSLLKPAGYTNSVFKSALVNIKPKK